MHTTARTKNILLIDSYDSFSFNLASLVRDAIPDAIVHVLHNDDFNKEQLYDVLPSFDAVIVGPGPGSPNEPVDVGVLPALWDLPTDLLLPIFGVCLGHQSLCLHLGGELSRLPKPIHGLVHEVEHTSEDIFAGVQTASVVRYHSLHVKVPLPSTTSSDASTARSSQLVPLAWKTDIQEDGSPIQILMSARHRTKPFWGIQYHPESICTNGGGLDVVKNFWTLASSWNVINGRETRPLAADWRHIGKSASLELHPSPFAAERNVERNAEDPVPVLRGSFEFSSPQDITAICDLLRGQTPAFPGEDSIVILDSSAKPGRFTIIGLVTQTTPRISHVLGDSYVSVRKSLTTGEDAKLEEERFELENGQDAWAWMARYMAAHPKRIGAPELSFWGGFIGYTTYEAGLASIDVELRKNREAQASSSSGQARPRRPDLNFAWIERSVVIDHEQQRLHVQSIANVQDSQESVESKWIDATLSVLRRLAFDASFTPASSPPIRPLEVNDAGCKKPVSNHIISSPSEEEYVTRIKQSQEFLASGDSYELCLTALTRIHFPSSSSSSTTEHTSNTLTSFSKSPARRDARPWHLFKTLRTLNPAPYGAFIRLNGTSLVGSSPERFLSWSTEGECQLRPIKGTIKKDRGVGVPEVTYEEASEMLLGSPKEIAENLMIVDLIRHDLFRVVSAGIEKRSRQAEAQKIGVVSVPKLFVVEEYKTVFQLVTVIEGQVDMAQGYTGFDVLARSLPPGSMTGAPKKRSCELLQDLETYESRCANDSKPVNHWERGVYSGTAGYWSVSGAGDFSVIIRSAFRYDDECTTDGAESWYVGAGGAITALADPLGEWEEMKTKRDSTLRAFDHI